MRTSPTHRSSLELFERFESMAKSRPEQVLVRELAPERSVTARELLSRVRMTMKVIEQEKLPAGEIVLLSSVSGTSFLVGALAVWACRGVLLATDPQVSGAEVEVLSRTFGPRIIVTVDKRGNLEIGVRREGIRARGSDLLHSAALIKLSSGSEGRPQGIAVTAQQLLADGRQIIAAMGLTSEDHNIGVVPLSHSYGLGNLVLPLILQGSPLLLVPAPLPDLLARALSLDCPTVFPAVPYLFEVLSRPDGPDVRPSGLRLCISAGAPLNCRTAARFRERFGLPIRAFYGTSETGGITYDASADGGSAMHRDGGVGTVLPGVEVSLEETGRVVVRGTSVALGYTDPQPHSGSGGGEFRSGSFRTGDRACWVERNGTRETCLTGRLGRMINVLGRKVDPSEIERILLEHSEVSDVAVLGMTDASRGESILACLVVRDGVSRDGVLAHLRVRVAHYKLPRRLLFLEALPRSERGKLDRKALQRQVKAKGIDLAPGAGS